VFGEEEGDTSTDSGIRWIIDPIDGTKNFSWGIPIWGTLIALEDHGEIVCGVVSAPALGERFAAGRGLGATRNGERIRVSDIDDLNEARMGFGSVTEFDRKGWTDAFRSLLSATAHDRGIGDFYGHMLVASGALDLMIEPQLNPWDLAPLIVIVEEAGGRLTDLDGTPHIYGGSVITTNARLHDAVMGHLSA
jgi:histidinol-phosphatase